MPQFGLPRTVHAIAIELPRAYTLDRPGKHAAFTFWQEQALLAILFVKQADFDRHRVL
jgi:hypothetical protein